MRHRWVNTGQHWTLGDEWITSVSTSKTAGVEIASPFLMDLLYSWKQYWDDVNLMFDCYGLIVYSSASSTDGESDVNALTRNYSSFSVSVDGGFALVLSANTKGLSTRLTSYLMHVCRSLLVCNTRQHKTTQDQAVNARHRVRFHTRYATESWIRMMPTSSGSLSFMLWETDKNITWPFCLIA